MRVIAHVSALRPMDDSVNWSAIPIGTPLVAGYVPPSGFAWPQAAWDRFAGSVEVRITPSVVTTGAGIAVLDVETGDATAGQAPGWAHTQRGLNQIPTIYTSQGNWQNVIDAFNNAGEPQPEYWIAAYPGDGQALPTLDGITAIAHQYADPNSSGGDYDLSVVADYWPGVDGGNVTDPVETNIEGFVATGGTTVDASANGTIPAGVDPYSIFGRLITLGGFTFQGGTTVDASSDGTVPSNVDPNSLFGRAVTTQATAAEILTAVNALTTSVQALSGALSTDETAILAAVAGVDSDVKAGISQLAAAIAGINPGTPTDAQVQALAQPLATALVPLLPADTTPAQFVAALAAALNTGGSTS